MRLILGGRVTNVFCADRSQVICAHFTYWRTVSSSGSLFPKLHTLRKGKLASQLASRITPMHMTHQVRQMTCCLMFELKFWAHFVVKFATFCWCLWRTHRFLCNYLDLIDGNISGQKSCLHSCCQYNAWKVFCSCTTQSSVLLSHTTDLYCGIKAQR